MVIYVEFDGALALPVRLKIRSHVRLPLRTVAVVLVAMAVRATLALSAEAAATEGPAADTEEPPGDTEGLAAVAQK